MKGRKRTIYNKCPICNNDCNVHYRKNGTIHSYAKTCGKEQCRRKLLSISLIDNKNSTGNQNALGYKHTELAKKQIGQASKGNKYALGNTNRRGKKCSIVSIQKMCKSQKERVLSGKSRFVGESNPNYKDGKGYDRDNRRSLEMHKSEYKFWRRKVFIRDGYACQNEGCNVVGGNLHAHHIKPWFMFPSLRYEIDNGQTLCIPCHKKIHIDLQTIGLVN